MALITYHNNWHIHFLTVNPAARTCLEKPCKEIGIRFGGKDRANWSTPLRWEVVAALDSGALGMYLATRQIIFNIIIINEAGRLSRTTQGLHPAEQQPAPRIKSASS